MKLKYLAIMTAMILAGCNSDGSSESTSSTTDSTEVITTADGWAAVDGAVTGGKSADSDHIYTVSTRSELIKALYGSSDADLTNDPSDDAKIIYITGTIDLIADSNGDAEPASYFMAQADCGTEYTDYDTFFTAYKNKYDPNVWNNQSLVDGKPPEVEDADDSDVADDLDNDGDLALEGMRRCYQKAQAAYGVLRVGSNTSIIGVGSNATLKDGNLVLGSSGATVDNIIIRNINFVDPFDYFPAWDPTDSFSIDTSEYGTTNSDGTICSATYVSDTENPNQCESISGGRWNSQYDAVTLNYATHVWIDHNYFTDGARTDDLYPSPYTSPYDEHTQKIQHHDGQVDITNGSTDVTVSYNLFEDHDKTNLLGGSDTAKSYYGPGEIDVTFHHNYWNNVGQRLPRVRFGRVHVYNNYYNLSTSEDASPYYPMGTALTLGTASKIYAENNVFDVDDSDSSSDKTEDLVSYNSKSSNKTKCEKLYSEDECGTYFYGAGNLLNDDDVDLVTIAQENAAEKSTFAPLTILDPDDSGAFWLPSQSYDYTLQNVNNVKAFVISNAGTGKIDE